MRALKFECSISVRHGLLNRTLFERPFLNFDDLVEGVVKNTIDHFSSVVDHQVLN
jgi:hypothetical protein